MKVHRLEVLVVNSEDFPEDNVIYEVENSRWVSIEVKKIETREVKDWDDDHPLNQPETHNQAYQDLFN